MTVEDHACNAALKPYAAWSGHRACVGDYRLCRACAAAKRACVTVVNHGLIE